MKFYFGEDNIRLIQLLDVASQVVSELLEGGVERHLVHGSRQLGAPGARVGHHPGVLKEGKVRGWQQQQFYLLAASLSVIVSILYSKLGCGTGGGGNRYGAGKASQGADRRDLWPDITPQRAERAVDGKNAQPGYTQKKFFFPKKLLVMT